MFFELFVVDVFSFDACRLHSSSVSDADGLKGVYHALFDLKWHPHWSLRHNLWSCAYVPLR